MTRWRRLIASFGPNGAGQAEARQAYQASHDDEK
jgi:hypothetical protein